MSAPPISTSLQDTLKLQRAAYLANPYPSLEERKAELRKLQAFIRENREAIINAISADCRSSDSKTVT
jgi:coniferyl-aldehyde dehydrogenase